MCALFKQQINQMLIVTFFSVTFMTKMAWEHNKSSSSFHNRIIKSKLYKILKSFNFPKDFSWFLILQLFSFILSILSLSVQIYSFPQKLTLPRPHLPMALWNSSKSPLLSPTSVSLVSFTKFEISLCIWFVLSFHNTDCRRHVYDRPG